MKQKLMKWLAAIGRNKPAVAATLVTAAVLLPKDVGDVVGAFAGLIS